MGVVPIFYEFLEKIKKYSKIFKKTLDYLQKLVYTYNT